MSLGLFLSVIFYLVVSHCCRINIFILKIRGKHLLGFWHLVFLGDSFSVTHFQSSWAGNSEVCVTPELTKTSLPLHTLQPYLKCLPSAVCLTTPVCLQPVSTQLLPLCANPLAGRASSSVNYLCSEVYASFGCTSVPPLVHYFPKDTYFTATACFTPLWDY